MLTTRKGRELQGLPVLDLNTGKSLGEIKDILYCPETRKVIGFVLADGGWFWGAKLLLYDQISAVGPDVVLVNGETKIHNTKYHSDYKKVYQDRIDIRGNQLISDNGQIIGTIKDIIIDNAGNIAGYELSDGVVHDLLAGRKSIPATENMVVSNDVVILQSMKDEFEGMN